MKKNVLVFPCGSEVALEIYRSVRYSAHFKLIGANSVSDHGQYIFDDYIGDMPFVDSRELIPRLKEVVKTRKIDFIYPAMDSAIAVLKENQDELGCYVVSSPVETAKICLSKRRTYEVLGDTVCVPKEFKSFDEVEYPVFIKPEIGYGSRGVKLVDGAQELLAYMKENPSYMMLEHLPGEEYTVDCFTDRNGNLLYAGARSRDRVKAGISVCTSLAEKQSEFEAIARAINEKMFFRGAWFFQVKRKASGKLCLLEVASRLGGSSSLARARGVNFALLSLFDAANYNVSVRTNAYDVELDRALDNRYRLDISYNCVYVDYDDCLILDKTTVNAELVSFLYKCVNKGIRLVLLTKHEGDLESGLRKFRIDSLFDEVIHICKHEKKSEHIKLEDAIFIDDSHAEREDVAARLSIPVFSPDMIQCLM